MLTFLRNYKIGSFTFSQKTSIIKGLLQNFSDSLKIKKTKNLFGKEVNFIQNQYKLCLR